MAKIKMFGFLFLLFISMFLVSCSLFDGQLKVIKKAEDVANNWDMAKFSEIYENSNNLNKINIYKENVFDILRTACEGEIYFKIINKTFIVKERTKIIINMYCNGVVDFKKLSDKYDEYKNAVRQEAKKDNFIDDANVYLIQKNGSWLIQDFQY